MSIAKRRAKEREERRTCILAAAQKVFDERGVAAATMDQVAAAAEVSKGTVYLYFKSKDELFMALASKIQDAFLQKIRPIADTGPTGLSEFRRMIVAYTEIGREHPNTIRNSYIWLATGDEVDTTTAGFLSYRAKISEIHACMVGALQRGIDDGSVRSGVDPFTTVAQVWSSLMGGLVLYFNYDEMQRRIPKPIDREQLVDGLVDLLITGLHHPAYDPSQGSPS